MSNELVHLRGITWDHPRGIKPLRRTSEKYQELHPAVRISWDVRPLRAFEEQPILELARRYDLITLDHPLLGSALADAAVLPLDSVLPGEFVRDLDANSVGHSHQSYRASGQQWALAIDASAQMSALAVGAAGGMPDCDEPDDRDLFEVAAGFDRESIGLPLNPTHLLCLFFALCATGGGAAGANGSHWLTPWLDQGLRDPECGSDAIEIIYRIIDRVSPMSASADPIAILDAMSRGRIQYAPVLYGYSTYSRINRCGNRVRFGPLPMVNGIAPRPVLGGVGLAVSRFCRQPVLSTDYVRMVAGPEWQTTIYPDADGQPAHLKAWTDREVNREYGGFFNDTLETVNRSLVRPRVPAYPSFQRSAGDLLHRMVFDERARPRAISQRLADLWDRSGIANHEYGDA